MRAHERERYDRALEELRECRVKLQRVHDENKHLRRALAEQTDTALRDEARRLRKALSYIGCNPAADPELFRRVARVALGVKPASDPDATAADASSTPDAPQPAEAERRR